MTIDVVVIGAGQAGLAAGYFLKKRGVSFLLVDQGTEVGESWAKRYDSLVLFTPRKYSSLPDFPMPGDQEGFPTKDEVAAYLKQYAHKWNLPIKHGVKVKKLEKKNGLFVLSTTKGTVSAKQVIIATGPFQTPFVPGIAHHFSSDVYQIHSSHYQHEEQLPPGPVLVVGGGNSGAHIAVELAKTRKTYLSVGKKPSFLPLTLLGKSIFSFFDRLGIYRTSPTSFIGRMLQKKGDPVFGSELKRALAHRDIILMERAVSANGKRVTFSDGQSFPIGNIVWATGFRRSYSWIHIKGTVDEETGSPLHTNGISPEKGLYFVGLPWQTCRGSALLLGVGKDAETIVNELMKKDV